MPDAVPGTDFRLSAKFLPNLFSSFGGTDRQTNSKLNITHYLVGDKKYKHLIFSTLSKT